MLGLIDGLVDHERKSYKRREKAIVISRVSIGHLQHGNNCTALSLHSSSCNQIAIMGKYSVFYIEFCMNPTFFYLLICH